MVAGENQPAAFKLDAVSRPGVIVTPLGFLNVFCDFDPLGPRLPVVVAVGDEHAILKAIGTAVAERQPDRTSFAIDNRANISDGDFFVGLGGHGDDRSPGLLRRRYSAGAG